MAIVGDNFGPCTRSAEVEPGAAPPGCDREAWPSPRCLHRGLASRRHRHTATAQPGDPTMPVAPGGLQAPCSSRAQSWGS